MCSCACERMACGCLTTANKLEFYESQHGLRPSLLPHTTKALTFVHTSSHHFFCLPSINNDTQHTTAMATNSLVEQLISGVAILVSGACGPNHAEPYELTQPSVRAYNEHNHRGDGNSVRLVLSPRAKDGVAIIQDQYIVTTWSLPNSPYEVFF
jgi:hypothetical protein